MKNKKIYTRKEFERFRIKEAERMVKNLKLKKDALNILVEASKHHWIHQTNWFGEPILNLPQDMFALQEIIYNTRPDYIIESGVAWGGSLLFYATLMKALGGKKIIGIDIFIPDDLKKRLSLHGELSKKLTLINGSSIEKTTLQKVKSIIGRSKKVMVMLDSHHTHDHVLRELELYSPLVGKGQYLICEDTIVEETSKQKQSSRSWGLGNNPGTALKEFLRKNKDFTVDKVIENKLLFTCNPKGFLVHKK